jgi:hypothetical protein
LLLVYGFLVLVVAFEYRKHGVAIVRDTTNYLFSLELNAGARYASQILLADVMPVAFYLSGLLLLAMSLQGRKAAR